ncbi:SHOCT domain-containing protein [Kribbella sp. CA-247076]|uniref:SHOCT domain-containing protein n=1 Tax=Kribbella sp. CA-247076 TaxID=3239941 RepID=UPI003D909202
MPGLLRGIARTAVVAGTATAVSGRVQRRQAERYAERDAAIAAEREQAYGQQFAAQQSVAPQPAPPVAQQPTAPAADPIQQLKDLAELKAQGILTDEEFALQKARILGG